jgi:hypothetical protein
MDTRGIDRRVTRDPVIDTLVSDTLVALDAQFHRKM